MMTKVLSGAVDGIDGYVVTVEVDVSRGLPAFQIVGLPNAAVRESRERVLSAVRNSGFAFPLGRVTVNLAPADIRKEGASFDAAIALGVIAAQNGECRLAPGGKGGSIVLGELSLFGELRPVRGLLAIVLDASRRGQRTVVVPACQAWEARLIEDIEVIGAATLSDVVAWWRDGVRPQRPSDETARRSRQDRSRTSDGVAAAGFLGLVGQPEAQRAAMIAAAGRHNLLLIGPPGTGKTRLARSIEGLQPPLAMSESLEVSRIHSAAGTLRGGRMLNCRPFRAPHHTITRAGLVGGGAHVRPGEVTLAHLGILFLDEVTEFAPAALEALREPLEEGRIAVVRGTGSRTFPAAFQLVAAMNPCRCGFLGSLRRSCRCTATALTQYRGRLSGPFLDRVDLFVEMSEQPASLLDPQRGKEARKSARPVAPSSVSTVSPTWSQLRRQIARSWRRLQKQHAVLAGANPDLCQLMEELGVEAQGLAYLERARQRLALSIRGVLRCVRVARTIANLGDSDAVTKTHLAEALNFRLEVLAGFAGGAPVES